MLAPTMCHPIPAAIEVIQRPLFAAPENGCVILIASVLRTTSANHIQAPTETISDWKIANSGTDVNHPGAGWPGLRDENAELDCRGGAHGGRNFVTLIRKGTNFPFESYSVLRCFPHFESRLRWSSASAWGGPTLRDCRVAAERTIYGTSFETSAGSDPDHGSRTRGFSAERGGYAEERI